MFPKEIRQIRLSLQFFQLRSQFREALCPDFRHLRLRSGILIELCIRVGSWMPAVHDLSAMQSLVDGRLAGIAETIETSACRERVQVDLSS